MLHFSSQKEGIEKELKAEATRKRKKTGVCDGCYFRRPCCRFSKAIVGEGLLKTLHFPESTTCHSERKHVGKIKLLGEFL